MPLLLCRHQSKWQRQHINHGRMTKLAVAAAAGAFVLGLAKQQVQPSAPEPAVLQVSRVQSVKLCTI